MGGGSSASNANVTSCGSTSFITAICSNYRQGSNGGVSYPAVPYHSKRDVIKFYRSLIFFVRRAVLAQVLHLEFQRATVQLVILADRCRAELGDLVKLPLLEMQDQLVIFFSDFFLIFSTFFLIFFLYFFSKSHSLECAKKMFCLHQTISLFIIVVVVVVNQKKKKLNFVHKQVIMELMGVVLQQ